MMKQAVEDAVKQRLRDPVLGPITVSLAAANWKIVYTLATGVTNGPQALKQVERMWAESWWHSWLALGAALFYVVAWPWVVSFVQRLHEFIRVNTSNALKKIRYKNLLTVAELHGHLDYVLLTEQRDALMRHVLKGARSSGETYLGAFNGDLIKPGTFARFKPSKGTQNFVELFPFQEKQNKAVAYVDEIIHQARERGESIALVRLDGAIVSPPNALPTRTPLLAADDGRLLFDERVDMDHKVPHLQPHSDCGGPRFKVRIPGAG